MSRPAPRYVAPELFSQQMDAIIPRDEVFLEASLRGAPLSLMQKKPPPLSRRFDQLASDILDRMMPTGSKAEDDAPISLLV